jgi:ABC-type nitrate/sulfonate/bicarbonate transport system permease component
MRVAAGLAWLALVAAEKDVMFEMTHHSSLGSGIIVPAPGELGENDRQVKS